MEDLRVVAVGPRAPGVYTANRRSVILGRSSASGVSAGLQRYCARRWANSRRTLSVRPHIGTTSTRPSRTWRTASSPRMPAAVELQQHAVHRGRGGGVPELVCAPDQPVPVVPRVALGVALREDHRRLHVAALVGDPQVELEIGPVARQLVDDPLELRGQGHGRSVLRAPAYHWTHGHQRAQSRRARPPRPDRGRRCPGAARPRPPDGARPGRARVSAGPGHQRRGGARPGRRVVTRRSSTPRAASSPTCACSRSRPEELWLDLEEVARETALRELTMYKIGRRVEIDDGRRPHGAVRDRAARVGGARARRYRRRARRLPPSTRGRTAPTTRSWPPPTRLRPAGRAGRSRGPDASAERGGRRAGVGGRGRGRAHRARPPALRRRHERREPPGRGRHRRAGRELHEGLLRRPGAGRAHVPQGTSQPPPAGPAALGAGRARHLGDRRRQGGRPRSARRASPHPRSRSHSRSCAARWSPATRSRPARRPQRSSSPRSDHSSAPALRIPLLVEARKPPRPSAGGG